MPEVLRLGDRLDNALAAALFPAQCRGRRACAQHDGRCEASPCCPTCPTGLVPAPSTSAPVEG